MNNNYYYHHLHHIICWFLLWQICATDSLYHVVSPTPSCTVVAQLNETLSLVCVHRPTFKQTPSTSSSSSSSSSPLLSLSSSSSSFSAECRFRSFLWKRLDANGKVTNVSETRKFNLWSANTRSAADDERISFLRIVGLQMDDLSRYRCDVECEDEKGQRFYRHHVVTICLRQSQHHFAICETHLGSGNCERSFSNGVCDSSCDHESQLFDGFDCVVGGGGNGPTGSGIKECRIEIDQKCRRSYADGTCDVECDSGPCAWDGGDCIDKPLRLVDDVLVLTIAEQYHQEPGHPMPRPIDGKTVSRVVSRLLWTVVRALTNDWVQDRLNEARTDQDGRIWRRRHREAVDVEAADGEGGGMKIFLKIDNTNCVDRCFNSAVVVAKFISLSLRKGWNPGFHISSAAVLHRVSEKCFILNDTSRFKTSPFDGDQSSSADWQNYRLPSGYNGLQWGEESKGTILWIVVAAVAGGMTIVLLVFAVGWFAHRVANVYRLSSRPYVRPESDERRERRRQGQQQLTGRPRVIRHADRYGTEV